MSNGRPTTRRRRTKDETRELLLAGGMRVLAERLGGTGGRGPNPVADVRITDALDAANAALLAADAAARPMTTGAAYNIWPGQGEFQVALLDRVLTDTALPGFERVRAVVVDALADRQPWEVVLMRAFEADFDESFASPAMYAMLGLTAMAPAADFAARQAEANAAYVRESGRLLLTIMHHGGRRLCPGRTIEDLVWAVEALEAGYLLRRRVHPDVPLRPADDGRSAFAASIVGVFAAFTEPAPVAPGPAAV